MSHICAHQHIFASADLFILLFYIQFVLEMSSSNHCQRHKHCKPDCVSHSAFACSLRKYSVSKSTHFSSVNHDLSKSRKKQNLQRKKSVSYIKPFIESKQNVNRIPVNANQPQKSNKKNFKAEVKNKESHQQQQIQSLIMKVSLEAKKNEGHRIQPYIINRQNTNKTIAPNQTEETKVKPALDADGYAKVKSTDFSKLQLNVDKISKIVDLFKKKVEGIESFNASERQQKNQFLELSQFTTQQRTPEPELENPGKPYVIESYSVSPVLTKKQFNFEYIQQGIKIVQPHQMSTKDRGSAQTQKNRGSKAEKEEVEKGLILMKQNSRKVLNYKMFQGSSKLGYTNSKASNKCHGHSIEM